MSGFKLVCAMMVARKFYEGGRSVSDIAEEAGVSETTVRKWLKDSGARRKA